MQKNRKLIAGICLVGVLIAVIAFIVWLKPQDRTSPAADANSTQSDTEQSSLSVENALQKNSASGSFSSPSQQDVQINCQLSIDASNRMIVNESTKNCFEFFITQYGEKTIDQIKKDFIAYAKATYQEPLLSQLIDLWSRYIQYREQLGQLDAPNIDKEQAAYYKAIFNSMKSLRQKFFSNYEIEGLFGTEDTYNDYTLARMAIMEDKTLSAAEKAQKLKALFEQLPEDWKENLKQLSQLEDLRKLTADIKARGGSAAEIREMRMNLVGPEATQRLENLDTERNQFKTNITRYLAERDTIIQSNMSDSAKQSAIDQLRQKNFSHAQDRLRVETFESVHDRGGKLPFAD